MHGVGLVARFTRAAMSMQLMYTSTLDSLDVSTLPLFRCGEDFSLELG
jgi:hypothetical protein